MEARRISGRYGSNISRRLIAYFLPLTLLISADTVKLRTLSVIDSIAYSEYVQSCEFAYNKPTLIMLTKTVYTNIYGGI